MGSGFKTFVRGPLASADVNGYLMKQANIVCTSSSRPSPPEDGMEIYETDTGLKQIYRAGAGWRPLLPSVTRSIPGACITGSNWDGITQLIDYAFSAVVPVADAAGSFTVPLPAVLPNGLLSAVMALGDSDGQSLISITPNTHFHTLHSVNGNAFKTPIGGTTQYLPQTTDVRVECRVLGW